MANPKLEGRITADSAWVISVTEATGPVTDAAITVAAGDYYLTSATSLLTALKTALDGSATLNGVYTVSLADDADTDTGKVTISAPSVGNISITWSNTDIRDRLGFTGDVSGATTHTGTEQAEYLYLPPVGRDDSFMAPDGDAGLEETDLVVSTSPDGSMVATKFQTRYLDSLGFSLVKGSAMYVKHEATDNESLQKFYQDVLGKGLPFRYHKDRSDDATFVTWRAPNAVAFRPDAEVPGWDSPNALHSWREDVRKEV